MKTRVSTTAPWFIPGGHLVGLRPDLLEVLRALDGKSPREIFAERKEEKPKADAYPRSLTGQPEGDAASSVAVVPLIGGITQYEGVCDWMFGGCSLEVFMAALDEAYWDPAVSAIVILCDSPGGEVAGIADAADRIRAMADTKPIVTFVSGDNCSAAYWLTSASSEVVISQTGLAGSIGVVMTYVDDSEAEKMSGVRRVEFVSSIAPDKRPDINSDDGKAKIQAIVDEYGTIFVDSVAKFRGVTPETVKSDFGQGGVLIGAKAVEAGLADQVGTLEETIRVAAALAGASTSTTGNPPTTARATGQGHSMTAAQLRADHPDAAAEIANLAASAERDRITGILTYNTPGFRAVAGDKIDAAIKDGKTTAGDLAIQILDAQKDRNKAVADNRAEDAKEVEVENVDQPEEPTAARRMKNSATGVYGRMNGGVR